MANERLTGSDSTLYKYKWGTPLTTGVATKGAIYKIAKKSVSSAVTTLLDGDLVADNLITTTVNSVPIATAFVTTHEATMTAHIAAISAGTSCTAVANGTKGITITAPAGVNLVVTQAVTLGESRAEATVTPSDVFGGDFEVGDIWMGDGVKTFTTDDSASLGTEEIIHDCAKFDFSMSADSIEVTVLKDKVKKYRKGKNDMTGNISGINFVSEMRKAGSVLNRFLKVIVGDSNHTNAPVVNTLDNSDFYIKAYLNDEKDNGSTQVFLFGQVELYGYSLGADIGSAQEWSSEVKFIGADPVIWMLDNV